MMEAAATIELLNDLERRYPVSEWRVGETRVWPLARLELWWAANRDYAALQAEARSESVLARRTRQLMRQPADLTRWAVSRVRGRDHATLAAAEALVLGDSVSRIKIEGTWFDRLTDPIVDALSERGVRALQLEPYHLYRSPLRRPAVHIQATLDSVWLRSRAVPGAIEVSLPGHAELYRDVEAAAGAVSTISEQALRRQGHHLRLLTEWFEKALRATGARLGVLVDHGVVQMAFNAACVRRGILSVELQHGVMVGNGAYSRWESVPADGYELLPSRYWCWSAREVAEIESWSDGLARHQPVLGGNLWLQRWRDGSDPLVRRFDTLLGREGPRRRVLVTLSRGFTSAEHLRGVHAAVRSDTDRGWWVRAHPAMTEPEFAAAMTYLSSAAPDRVSVADAEVPLYAFLRQAAAHVTAVSSTTLEARALCVPTVLTNPTAPGLFPDEAAQGWAVLAEDGDAILRALDRFAAAPPPAEPGPEPRPAPEVVAELIAG